MQRHETWASPYDPQFRSGEPHFKIIVACTIGFCLIRQSSADPIAVPRRTRIGSVNAHNSVRYFNRPVDRSVTNLAIQFRLGILPSGGLGLLLVIVLIFALMGRV
jgi:hypothetical protein